MKLQPHQKMELHDNQGRLLGQVVVEQIQDDLVFGRFYPGERFTQVEPLFTEYVKAANDQVLSVVGELTVAIAALGLNLRSADDIPAPSITDVQISGDEICFRTTSPQSSGHEAPPLEQGAIHENRSRNGAALPTGISVDSLPKSM